MQGRLPGTDAECVDSAFERRDALFEHVIGWVVYPGVTVPFDFEIEQRRSMLGAFGLKGSAAHQMPATLSGGERAKLALAILASSKANLLLLDEPTNNLDLASVRQLAQALEGYRGAVIVASHDLPFLRSIGITRWLRLDRDIGLTVTEPR